MVDEKCGLRWYWQWSSMQIEVTSDGCSSLVDSVSGVYSIQMTKAFNISPITSCGLLAKEFILFMCAAFFSDAESKAGGVYKSFIWTVLRCNSSMNEYIAMQKYEFSYINSRWFIVVYAWRRFVRMAN